MIESEPKQPPIREQIDDLLDNHKFDDISKLPEFEKVDDRKNWMEGEGHFTCTSHVFGKGKYVSWKIENGKYLYPDGYTEVETPKTGDIIFYFRDNAPSHVGIYSGDGKVESKLGIGHVYKHPIFSVPTYYGNEAPRYFRKK